MERSAWDRQICKTADLFCTAPLLDQIANVMCSHADIHEPFTTVKEALTFSANMRITNPPDSAATRSYVDEVSPAC